MTEKLHIQSKHLRQVQAILERHMPDVGVWAYGSRVSGRSHDGSDLDIVLRAPGLTQIPLNRLGKLADAFQESNIPFLIEALDWSRLPNTFHQEIARNYAVLRSGWVQCPPPHSQLDNSDLKTATQPLPP